MTQTSESELERWRTRAEELAQELDDVTNRALKNALQELDAVRRETNSWRDRAFRQGRETIQKGIEAARAKKEQAKAEEQCRQMTDLADAYRKIAMLEHARAEAGERMIAAMRKDKERAS